MKVNSSFAKLVNGELSYMPVPTVIDGVDVFTNDPAIILTHGYKPVVRVAMPAAIEGYNWVASWVESDTAITQTWTQEAIPVDDSATEQDYIDALTDLGVNTSDES